MPRLLRSDTALPVRHTVATATLSFGLIVWALAWLDATSSNSLSVPTALAGLTALCLGFLGLGAADDPRAPGLASRINAVLIVVLSLALFAGFPRLPFIAVFAVMVATAIASLLTFRTYPSLAFTIVAVQAVLGLYLGWAVAHLATTFPISAPARVPLALWAILSVSSFAAVWHARRLRGASVTRVAHAS